MSYLDDEELKMSDTEEDELDDADLDLPVDDDLVAIDDAEDDDDLMEGFAGLDGTAEY
jgi:hypothetical protein